jgi:hypothetical protein
MPPAAESRAGRPAAPPSAVVESRAERAVAPPPAAAGAVAPMLAKRAMRDETSARSSPDDFIARIREAFSAGKPSDAQRELKAFRAAYPDADTRLPEDLRAWAAGVPPR